MVFLFLLAVSVFTYSQTNPYALLLAKTGVVKFNEHTNDFSELPSIWPPDSVRVVPKQRLSPCSSYVESANSGLLGHLFDADIVYGDLSFSVAKFVDTIWDVGFGRGGQMLMAWAMYHLLVSSIMWIMENRPVPYGLFVNTTMSATDMTALFNLGRFGTTKIALRHKLLVVWMIFAISWVAVFPIITGAMTGYINWVDPNTNTLVKLHKQGLYMNLTDFIDATEIVYQVHIDSNTGTPDTFTVLPDGQTASLWDAFNTTLTQLISDHTNITVSNFTYFCNKSILCPTENQNQTVSYLRSVGNITYDWTYTASLENVVCTQGFGYQWGFSSSLVLIFLICNTIWLVGIYITWETLEGQSEFKKKRRSMGRYRATVDLGDMIRNELGSDISALSDSALEVELKKRLPIRYHVSDRVTASGEQHAHIGLSSDSHKGEKFELEHEKIYA